MMDEIMICTFNGGCRGSYVLVEDCRVNLLFIICIESSKLCMYMHTYTYMYVQYS